MSSSSDNSETCNNNTGKEIRKLNEEKLLESDVMLASQCLPWEVKYYLDLEYTCYKSNKEMNGISPEDLMVESLNFCCRDYLTTYLTIYGITTRGLYNFTAEMISQFKYFEKNFEFDHSKATLEETRMFSEELSEDKIDIAPDKHEKIHLLRLMARWNKTLEYLKSDQYCQNESETKCKHEPKRNETETTCKHEDNQDSKKDMHEVMKGAFCEILYYLNIDVLYNGECNVDFSARLNDGKIHDFKMTPDICGYTDVKFRGKIREKIFLVVEVFRSPPNSTENLKVSSSKFSLSDEMDESPEEAKNEQKPTAKIVSSRRKLKNKATSTTRRKTHKETDTEIIRELRSELSACCPEACLHRNESVQLLGQLALKLYGTWQRNSSIGRLDCVVGLFIVNEFVYLAKIHGKKLTYAKDIWFNMNRPSDRCALLTFLIHLNKISDNVLQW